MSALEVVTARVTAVNGVFTAVTFNTGSTNEVRSHTTEGTAFLEEIWVQAATAGSVRIKSPRMHDDVVGIRMLYPAAQVRRLLPEEAKATLYPQDSLDVAIAGGAAEVDSVAMLIHYQDLGGINARLM